MATVSGLTAAAMLAIRNNMVVSGVINASGHLILTTHDGSQIDAGSATGAIDPDITTIAYLNPNDDDVIQRKSGSWANRSLAQLKVDLAIVNDVKNYGATGNGTNDDTTAIQAAIAALPATGGEIYFPPGSYLLNGSAGLSLASTGVTIRGAGAEATKIVIGAGFSGAAAISITANNCRVENLSIAGASSTTTSNPVAGGVKVSGARRSKINGCHFWYINGWAVEVLASTTNASGNPDGTMITRSVIRQCAGGVRFLGDTISGYAVNSFISDVQVLQSGVTSGASANLDGIRIEDAWDVLATNIMTWMSAGTGSCFHIKGKCAASFIENLDTLGPNGTPNAPSVLIEDGPNGSPQNVQIVGGVIQQGSVGVKISGGSSQVHLSTTRIINNSTHGIQVDGTATTIYLTELFFSLNGAAASGTNYDLNWSGTAVGAVTNCRFASPIVASGSVGVQQSVNVATAGQSVRFLGVTFLGSGSDKTNRFTNMPSAVLHMSGGTFEFLTDVNFAWPGPGRVALQPFAAGNNALSTNVGGSDAFDRWRLLGSGNQEYGSGAAARDTTWGRLAAAKIGSSDSNIAAGLAGKGFMVKEGSNAKMGTLVLNGATPVVVANTSVTATSRIFLTINAPGGTPAHCWVSARTVGTSFSVTGVAGDTSTVAWLIYEPA